MLRNKFILLQFIIILVFSLCLPMTISAEKEDHLESIKFSQSHFKVNVEIINTKNQGSNIVDKVTTFWITRLGVPKKKQDYQLYYFLDNRLQAHIKNVSLPYKFKQTYRGLLSGTYEVKFILMDNSGKTGVATLSIYVTH